MEKVYNALTGEELKKVILSEVERALVNADISGHGITYPMASWSWSLTILQQAGDTPEHHVEAGNPDLKVETPPSASEKSTNLCHCGRPLRHPGRHAKAPVNQDEQVNPSEKEIILTGGSERFQHEPPSPTEVRQAEKLPLPEA